MPKKYEVPISWAVDQAGTLAQLWLRDNAPNKSTPEEFTALFMDASIRILSSMTGKTPEELMQAINPDMDLLVSKSVD